ncbi:hypothetical protein NpPPO83_00003085 [Neofusicoccum parvum]|uniref:Uncharacterized protein n=1 Tax=Neofusicoccum parvum TaxID=310453 RepID=A0ACB5SFA6_9PEZI|nr:hypothetical protein NpPPO83_00003085 [Neofusicoccum parvum]
MDAHNNNRFPVWQLSPAEYHQDSLLSRHSDAFLSPTANHTNPYSNTTAHARTADPTPTYGAPSPVRHRRDPPSAAQNARLTTAGRAPPAAQLQSHPNPNLPVSPSHHLRASSALNTTTNNLAYPSPPSSSSSSGLPSPEQQQQQQPYRCDGCGKTFVNPQTLKRHKLEVASCPSHVRGGKERYTCFWCAGSFQRRDGLKQHLRERCGRTALEAEADVDAWYGAGRRRGGGR